VSYGAFLGLQTLRHAKKWIESAVLVSIPRPFGGTMVRSGQTAQAAVDTLARMCAEQPACAAYGDLSANVDALLTRLTAQPLDLGPSVPVQLTADLLGVFIQQALDNPLAASTFPKAVAGALIGETELWLPRVQAFLAQPAFDPDLVVSIPMHNSVWCSEELVIGSPEELQARAADSSRLVKRTALPPALAAYETCAVWPVPTAPAWFFGPVVSDIPTYLISGALDPVTAPDFARVALRHLSNGQLTIIAAAGHLASENSPCAPQLVEQFLEAPYAPIEDSCTAAPVPFVP
jgi:pimeloyl-ACP methyl ester carboxylesterase